jgi:hypothetical protein
MYVEHAAFIAPSDPETVIWRYMNMPQFLDMLERNALWFTQLGSQLDPFEGVPDDATLEEHRARNEYVRSLQIKQGGLSAEEAEALPLLPVPHPRDFTYVNCWHMNDYESLAMWNTYGDKGIAIRSSFSRLAESFRDTPQPIFIGVVTYRDRRDPKTTDGLLGNLLRFATRKGMSFEYERELRAVTTQAPTQTFPPRFEPGIRVEPVDLDVLVDCIYVAPGSQGWIKELVRRVMATYKLDKVLVDSALESRPDLT